MRTPYNLESRAAPMWSVTHVASSLKSVVTWERVTRLLHFIRDRITPNEHVPRWVLLVAAAGPGVLAFAAARLGVHGAAVHAAWLSLVILGSWWLFERHVARTSPSNYREDDFANVKRMNGIVWRWKWKDGTADPGDGSDLLPRILDLRPHCPRCRTPLYCRPWRDENDEGPQGYTAISCDLDPAHIDVVVDDYDDEIENAARH